LNHRRVVTALLAVFFVQLMAESRLKSPTSDEPPHIASGLSYVATGIFRGNPEHPPLVKELGGLSMLIGGIRWPRNPETDSLLYGERRTEGLQPEWEIGNTIIAANPDRVLFWARLPSMLIAVMLGALLFAWGRHIVGATAAVCAVLVYVTDPTILGHAFLVTNDVGLAAFTVLLLFALWRYVHVPSAARLVWCGIALGAALCAKFSAVLLLPAVGVLMLAAVVWPPELAGRVRARLDPFWRDAKRTFSSGGENVKPIGRNDPCPCGSGKKVKACHGLGGLTGFAAAGTPRTGPAGSDFGRRVAAGAAAFAIMCAIAYVVIQSTYFFSKDPLIYLHGLRMVDANHRPDAQAYLAGELQHRFAGYFAIAYLVKQPIAAIVLTLAGFVLLVRSKSIPRLGKWFFLVPALVMFAGPSLLADPIGIRYIVPTFPFAHLMAGIALAAALASVVKWRRAAAYAGMAWLVIADAGVFPDHLSYFNESACLLTQPGRIGFDGGSRCGVRWLDDSNIDWGQGLRQLKVWADDHGERRTIKFASIYGFPPDAYGLKTVRPPEAEILTQPVPGIYAISASIVARLNGIESATNWEASMKPLAIIGHSLYVYDVR
jgi:hypothetical protein